MVVDQFDPRFADPQLVEIYRETAKRQYSNEEMTEFAAACVAATAKLKHLPLSDADMDAVATLTWVFLPNFLRRRAERLAKESS